MNRFAIPMDDQVAVPKQGRVAFIKGYYGQVSGGGSSEGSKKHGRTKEEQQPHVRPLHDYVFPQKKIIWGVEQGRVMKKKKKKKEQKGDERKREVWNNLYSLQLEAIERAERSLLERKTGKRSLFVLVRVCWAVSECRQILESLFSFNWNSPFHW